MYDLTLKKEKMKSSSYGLLTDIALLVECLTSGQNCITRIICMKGKNLLRKNEEYTSLILMSYMGTLGHHLAKLEHEETRTHRRSFLKLSISSILYFFVLVLIPGQNCITCVIYSKGKSFKEKEKKYTSLVLMG